MEKLNKVELETAIEKEFTLGHYVFDIDKKCFFGDSDIEIYLFEVEKNIYRSCDVYYFDEIEIAISDEDTEDLVFCGEKDSVIQQAIVKFNKNQPFFMGFPIMYNNISIVFEDRQHLFSEDGDYVK